MDCCCVSKFENALELISDGKVMAIFQSIQGSDRSVTAFMTDNLTDPVNILFSNDRIQD